MKTLKASEKILTSSNLQLFTRRLLWKQIYQHGQDSDTAALTLKSLIHSLVQTENKSSECKFHVEQILQVNSFLNLYSLPLSKETGCFWFFWLTQFGYLLFHSEKFSVYLRRWSKQRHLMFKISKWLLRLKPWKLVFLILSCSSTGSITVSPHWGSLHLNKLFAAQLPHTLNVVRQMMSALTS